MATLKELDIEALIKVMTEPKNSLVKQYKKLFEFENIKLKLTEDAIRAIAEKALARKTGARGLRAVMEETMLDMMYELPSQEDIEEVVINKEVVANGEKPMMVYAKKTQAS